MDNEVVIVDHDGTEHVFPAGFDPQKAAAIVRQGAPVEAQQPTPSRGIGDRVADALPQVGGMVGSLTGGIGGAALGGAAGQGYGTLLKHAGEIPGAIADVARNAVSQPQATFNGFLQGAGQGAMDSGLSGAGQAAMDAGGQVAGAGLKVIGKGIYKGGVAMLPKSIKLDFPNMAKYGFDEAVAMTNNGMKKAGELAHSASETIKGKLGLLDRLGVHEVPGAELTNFGKIEGGIAKEGLRAGKTAEVDAFKQAFAAENPAAMNLTRTHELKQAESKIANTAMKKARSGAPINDLDAAMHKDLSQNARQALEDRVPGIRQENERLQAMMGLEQGAEHASNTFHWIPRISSAGTLGALGLSSGMLPAIAAGGAGFAATTPQGLTLAGLGLKKAGEAVGSRITPQLLRAALLAQLASEQ
jgi:hypothetical protein